MVGIERINIVSPSMGYTGEAERFWNSKRHWRYANQIYRSIFRQQGINLASGYKTIDCTKGDFVEGYDRALGIDAFFHFANGMTCTLQEKCLNYKYETTVTVEYMQDPQANEHGDWFNLKTQFYFVGYDSLHPQSQVKPDTIDEEIRTGICHNCGYPFDFQAWILLDWPRLAIEANRNDVNMEWELKNNNGYARASFQCANFSAIPPNCIIAKWEKWEQPQRIEETDKEIRQRARKRWSK